jgi:hypothetical protein
MNKNKRMCPRRLRRRGHIVDVLVNTVIIAIKLSGIIQGGPDKVMRPVFGIVRIADRASMLNCRSITGLWMIYRRTCNCRGYWKYFRSPDIYLPTSLISFPRA